ncbi:hypothetical protein MNBD_GAMMA22-2776 [hydrothermal vent metagenome]|uniref:Uncharacterized protein n=1 Tax=hydrothermal vent metagenome TaxID=652676 RepID=A0A3B0ZW73_9ZZZZ
MKKFQIFALFFLCFNFATVYSTPITQLNSKALPTIVLNSAVQPPLSTPKQDGFLDELAVKIFKKIGYKLILANLPAERALRSANSGLIDGELIRVKGMNNIYTNLIQIPESLITLKFVAFAKTKVNLSSGWDALKNKEIAFITGWKIYEKNVPKTASITKTSNYHELFTLLQKNRTDLALFSLYSGYYAIDELKINNVKPLVPELAEKKMFMYLNKKYKLIVPKIAKVLAKMKSDGSYNKLAAKHLLSLE